MSLYNPVDLDRQLDCDFHVNISKTVKTGAFAELLISYISADGILLGFGVLKARCQLNSELGIGMN